MYLYSVRSIKVKLDVMVDNVTNDDDTNHCSDKLKLQKC
jgi:hypothetical protein